jgi:DedD protein
LPTLFDKPPRPADQIFKVRMAAPDGAAAVSVKAAVPATAPQSVVAAPASSSVSGVAGSTLSLATAAGTAAVGMLPGTGKKPRADEAVITESKSDPKAEADARADRIAREKIKADRLKADKAREAEKVREAEQAREAEKTRLARAAKKAKDAQDARDAARKAKDAKQAKAAKASKADSDADKPRRYVIQAGSFAEAGAARELGRRIGKLGLDSHEQHVETAAGSARTRVRLGPFNSKEEALRAAARLKAAGLNAAVLPL